MAPWQRAGMVREMMDWDKLRIFHAVAAAGSLTRAGEELHLSQSAVSRQIRSLEESFDSTLFHRHARGLILTEQGELLFEATQAMARKLDSATARIRDSEEGMFGQLRVTTTLAFGALWLAPRLPALYAQYPDLKIDLNLDERVLNLPMREADIAIRMKEPSQADLIRRRLMNIRIRLYATEGYLETVGTPLRIEDLSKGHRLIYPPASAPQVAEGKALVAELLTQEIPSLLSVNNYFGVLQAVLSDLGIGALPDYLTEDFPNLVRVLPDKESKEVPVFLAYPEELRQSRRIAAFRDFVTEEVIAHRRAVRGD